MVVFWTSVLLLIAVTLHGAALEEPDLDLALYISRPELRAPLLNVTRYEANKVTPGYWFMAPYGSLMPASLGHEYVPFQAGPYIYDNTGELVWSGAELADNRNTYDFRLSTFDGAPALTFIIDRARKGATNPDGDGMILDSSYTVRGAVNFTDPSDNMDMHEFNVINDGKTSLSVFAKRQEVDISALGLTRQTGVIYHSGFREIDIASGDVIFEWYPLDHISLNETMLQPPEDSHIFESGWDCFHTNSVEKNSDGDYLLSMRYTSSIYKISGLDGSVIWRLGGKASDFVQDFNFSSQHTAKFYSGNGSVTIISFLDNASDEQNRQKSTSKTSAVKLVALYPEESPKRAKILKHFDRPDGGLTMLRGQAQFLANDGVVAGWSEKGYVSEFTSDGQCVFEAKYVGNRFNSYRTYKFEFVGRPTEPPALKVHAYGSKPSLSSMSSVFYVSWNGATEVASWNFYGSNDLSTTFQDLGKIARSGFETTYISKRFWAFSYVQALDGNGTVLGSSKVENIVLPNMHVENSTLDFYLEEKTESDREAVVQSNKSVLMVLIIIVIGLALNGLISISIFIWKRSDSWRRPLYSRVRNVDNAVEVGEMAALEYDEKSDDESEDEARPLNYAQDNRHQEEIPGTGRTRSTSIQQPQGGGQDYLQEMRQSPKKTSSATHRRSTSVQQHAFKFPSTLHKRQPSAQDD